MRIDLNADLGESSGESPTERDVAMMGVISSVSIASGAHAGNPSLLRQTIRLARAHGVAVGAHPGFADREGFGRRELRVTPSEVEDLVLGQIAAVAGVAADEGVRLQHVKAHGALYNMAARDAGLAHAIAGAVSAFDPSLIVFGPPGSELLAAARTAGLRIAAEAFADRAYRPDRSLAPRSDPGSVLSDPAIVVERALRLVKERTVIATDGSVLVIDADTICLHGDTHGAAVLAVDLRRALEADGVLVRAVGDR
jgi:UPF0271 protein